MNLKWKVACAAAILSFPFYLAGYFTATATHDRLPNPESYNQGFQAGRAEGYNAGFSEGRTAGVAWPMKACTLGSVAMALCLILPIVAILGVVGVGLAATRKEATV
jgi:hypothetical protein